MLENRHYALSREAILAALTAFTGITTADGATPANNTLICSALIGKNDFISGKTVLIGSGNALYEDKGAASFDNTDGTITVESPFSTQIKKGTLFRILNAASAGEVAELLDALVSYRGTTTADGAFGGGTLVCLPLASLADFDGNQVVIKSGPYAGQARDINGATNNVTGTVTPASAFGGTITEGTRFSITAIRTVPAEVAAIEAKLDAQKGAEGVFYEQRSVAIEENAIVASETNVVWLSVIDRRYIVRSLRLKCADPGVNTVIVRLKQFINDGLTTVDSFAITGANFGTYHSLVDMFGLPYLADDQIIVSVQASGGGPYAIRGQYSWAKTNV